jgi:hypothetical protein
MKNARIQGPFFTGSDYYCGCAFLAFSGSNSFLAVALFYGDGPSLCMFKSLLTLSSSFMFDYVLNNLFLTFTALPTSDIFFSVVSIFSLPFKSSFLLYEGFPPLFLFKSETIIKSLWE